MRTVILFLIVIGAVSCSQLQSTNMVCELWRGWGSSFAGEICSASINSSCTAVFEVVPDLIEFFMTFDFSNIGKLINNVYTAIKQTITQVVDCKYAVYLVNFIPHLVTFIANIGANFQKIQMDVFGFYMSITTGQFYQAGIFLGNIFKTIIVS